MPRAMRSCKFSGAGKVPVLKIEEGGKTVTVWDSLAICETLAERHPEAGLWPDDCGGAGRWRGPMRPKCIPAFPICATS